MISFTARGLSATGFFCYQAVASAGVVLILPGYTICELYIMHGSQVEADVYSVRIARARFEEYRIRVRAHGIRYHLLFVLGELTFCTTTVPSLSAAQHLANARRASASP